MRTALLMAASFVAGALAVLLLPTGIEQVSADEVERRTRPDAAPVRWNETGDVVETYTTFNVPTTMLRSVN